jgi:Asp-tRNA(Asn)/Glu-tRNA(Gln) amidotransferase A subunit family amidase
VLRLVSENKSLSNDLTQFSAISLAAMIRQRVVSPVEVVEAYLRRIDDINPRLNAIISLAPDVLDRARDAEKAQTRGASLGALHGVPLTIKDTIETAGLHTVAGSRRLIDHVPLDDAPAVARLKAAGALILGKTNVPEIAMTYECENPVYGRTLNPHNELFSPGGSSGGEAVAIAAHMSPAGLGTDLSGSIRIPANFCGIFGLKPTSGLVPTGGHIPPVIGPLSLGAAFGPMARSVEDLRLIFGALKGDGLPRLSVKTDTKVWKVCWYTGNAESPVSDDVATAVHAAVDVFRRKSNTLVESPPPFIAQATSLWIKLFGRVAPAYATSLYSAREDEAGEYVRKVLSSYHKTPVPTEADLSSIQIEYESAKEKVMAFLDGCDFVVAPVGATGAFPLGERKLAVGNTTMGVFQAFAHSQFCNVFGLPAVAAPVGRRPDGVPMGVQLIGRPGADEQLLVAAQRLEEAFSWTGINGTGIG